MGEHRGSAHDPQRETVVIRPEVVSAERLRGAGVVDPGGPVEGAPRSAPRRTRVLVATVLVGGLVAAAGYVYVNRPVLAVEGPADGQLLSRRDLATFTVRVDADGAGSDDVSLELNGVAVPLVADGDALVASAEHLRDLVRSGANTLVVTRQARFGIGTARVERSFAFDPSGPALMVPRAVGVGTAERPPVLRGLVDGATSLTADGRPVDIEPGGAFTVRLDASAAAVHLVATDADGNPAEASVAVTAEPPAPNYPPTAAVHVSARSWGDPAIREPILALARRGLINAVQLDIKDEGGEVGYSSAVPLAVASGAARGHYDAAAALDELHGLGVRVIGRIVCFLDPTLASWAWDNDRPEMVVMQGSGGPLTTDYGAAAFTNLADPAVRRYQIDLAREAVQLGFDEILYDHVRRPEGDLGVMYFPGLEGDPAVAVARFVVETDAALAGTGALLGVSVFGIAATRPQLVAQDIRLLAPHVDYVAPMVYPSHWGPGEYDVADPLRQPADIVRASVADFGAVVAGSGAAVVPWLQDFSAGGVAYGPVEVRAEIDAAMAAGAPGYLLWNAGSLYTAGALDPPTFPLED
jgi:hypothetical protein